MASARPTSERMLSLYVGLVVVFLALPIAIVIPSAFNTDATLVFPPQGFSLRWFANIAARPEFFQAFLVSVGVALIATAVSLVVGTLSAIALVRYRFPGREALTLLFLTPLIFPAIVLAVAIAMVLAPLDLLRTFSGLVLAHVVITLPYVIRTVGGTLTEIDRAYEEAAHTLGADRWRTFRHVTLPLLRPALLAAATFSLIISFDEFTISLFLVGPGLKTLPLEIYNYTDVSIDPTVAAISTLLILLTALAVIAIERLVGLGKQFS
ncbi:MAG: ABC transporter permease [Alphaproteobacteria bacterium]|nr:ABC transporter permease [Alphaproteobacteria bacterium]